MLINKKNVIFYFILLMIFMAILYVLTYGVEEGETSPLREVSIILRSRTDANWVALKQGIDQASLELNVDARYIMLSRENDAEEQIALIYREVQNGVNGIIINCSDSEGLSDILSDVSAKIPVITVDSPVNATGKNILHISANDESMGRALAEEILKNEESNKKIAIVNGAAKCSSMDDRIKGIIDTLTEKDIYCDVFLLNYDLSDVNEMTNSIIKSDYDVIICPDVATLERVALSFESYGKTAINIYGFGATGPIASYIENGVVNAVVVQNDYAVGYLCINSLTKTNSKEFPEIGFEVVNAENMYEGDIQKLMFPYIR